MLHTLTVKASGTVSGATSPVLDLSAYANASGTRAAKCRIDWVSQFEDGDFTSVVLQHSTDNSTYATLWDCGTLSGDAYIYKYTWYPYLRVLYSYTTGSTTSDAGALLKFTLKPYGLPDWSAVYACRWEHCRAIMPQWFALADGFHANYNEQREAAKRELYIKLKARGVNPDNLFSDGHQYEPVVPGLEIAGALLTMRYVLGDASVVKSESWQADMARLGQDFETAFDAALSAGLEADTDGDGSPADGPRTVTLSTTR